MVCEEELNNDMLNVDTSKLGTCAEDAISMHKAGMVKRARLRLPALFLTLVLELLVAFVISRYTDTFNDYPLLIAFQPVISAISGNVGLQSSSINVRALAVGLADVRKLGRAVLPEVKASVILGVTMGIALGAVALFWYSPPFSGDVHTWRGACFFSLAIFIGMFCSVMTAGLTGSAAPLVFKRCGFDPSAMAGPLETAFQDIVGGTILLAVSAAILSAWGDGNSNCDVGGCIDGCGMDAPNFDLAQKALQCVQACLADADAHGC